MTVRVTRYERFDLSDTPKAEKTKEGFLRVTACIARADVVQVYRRADKSEHREFRPMEEVAKSLPSFRGMPLTLDHPTRLLTDKTAAGHTIGSVSEPHLEGDRVMAELLVHDAAAIAAIMDGKRQVSCGYTAELDETPGEYKGQKYDSRQTSISGNHVACVSLARAPGAQLFLDSADAYAVGDEPTSPTEPTMPTPETALRTDEKNPDIEALRGEVAALRAQLAAKPLPAPAAAPVADTGRVDEVLAERVRVRVKLEQQAREVLGQNQVLANLDDVMVMRAVCNKLAPTLRVDSESDAFIRASFSTLMASVRSPTAIDLARRDATQRAPIRQFGDFRPTNPEDARAAYLERARLFEIEKLKR